MVILFRNLYGKWGLELITVKKLTTNHRVLYTTNNDIKTIYVDSRFIDNSVIIA